MEFFSVFAEALLHLLRNLGRLLMAVVFPLVVLIAAGLFKVDLAETVWIWGLLLLELLSYTLLAVTVHRIFILGNDSVGLWGLIGWSKRETYFAINLIVVFVLFDIAAAVVMVPVFGIIFATQSWSAAIGIALFLVPLSCWVAGRMSLLFPATAVDHKVDFFASWTMTKSHQLMMTLIMLSSSALILGELYLRYIDIQNIDVIAPVYRNIIVVLDIALLSIAYKRICDSQPPEVDAVVEAS